jgi:hypothetical protein
MWKRERDCRIFANYFVRSGGGAPPTQPQVQIASHVVKLRYAAEYLGLVCFLTLMAFEVHGRLVSTVLIGGPTPRRAAPGTRGRRVCGTLREYIVTTDKLGSVFNSLMAHGSTPGGRCSAS